MTTNAKHEKKLEQQLAKREKMLESILEARMDKTRKNDEKRQRKKAEKEFYKKVNWLHETLTELGLQQSVSTTIKLIERNNGDKYAALQWMIQCNGYNINRVSPKREKRFFGLW